MHDGKTYLKVIQLFAKLQPLIKFGGRSPYKKLAIYFFYA